MMKPYYLFIAISQAWLICYWIIREKDYSIAPIVMATLWFLLAVLAHRVDLPKGLQ